MKNIFLLLIMLYPAISFGNDLMWDIDIQDNEWAEIAKHPSGEYSLSSAIDSIPKDVWLIHFLVFPINQDMQMQIEIDNYLANQYPTLHAEALASAGNMHNPKVAVLENAFMEAILATSLVKRLNLALKESPRCERITSTSYEKLYIQTREKGQPIYNAVVWLNTEKCT